MENKAFLLSLIIFGLVDLYKFYKKDLNFFSAFRPLSLAIIYKFVLDGIDQRLYIISLFCFMAYYFLMTEHLFIDPFNGFALIPTIYFVIAIFTVPFAYGIVYDKIGKSFFVTLIILLTVAYVFGPIILIYKKLSK